MNSRKGTIDVFGMIITGLVIIAVVLTIHSMPVLQKIFKLGSESRVYLSVNDHTSNIVPIMETRVNSHKLSDTFSCLITGGDFCGNDERFVNSVVRSMDSKVILYTESGESKSYGNDMRGDILYADIPLPNGEIGRMGFFIPIALYSGESVDYTRRIKYGDCMEIGDDEYERIHLTRINFLGEWKLVNKLAKEDFLAVDAAVKECTDEKTLNYDFWRDPDGGTYNCRVNTNNKQVLSKHSFGFAVDINPDTNPNCPKDPVCEGQLKEIYDIPECAIAAFENNNFVWGGRWTYVKDYMHFEWIEPGKRTLEENIVHAAEVYGGDD